MAGGESGRGLAGVRTRPGALRGRGAAENPGGRFERLSLCWEEEAGQAANDTAPGPKTLFLRDPARTILCRNDSPDVPFDVSLNPYRGCEHGCSYCYARPTHEYLGLSAGLDFESRILVKQDAPALLRCELSGRGWRPQVVAIAGVTDAYQPIERRIRLTRRCLEIFAEFRNPVAIVTKSGLVVRDADVLQELARYDAAMVYVSITTLNRHLARVMEPRAAAPPTRLAAVAALADAGVPVGVMVAPVVPGLTDHEIPAIVAAAARSGARCARTIVLRLPHGLKDLFAAWLERHVPERRQKVLNRLLEIHGRRLNDPRFHTRMRGQGIYAEQIESIFSLACRRAGLSRDAPTLSTAAFRSAADPQLSLFAPD